MLFTTYIHEQAERVVQSGHIELVVIGFGHVYVSTHMES